MEEIVTGVAAWSLTSLPLVWVPNKLAVGRFFFCVAWWGRGKKRGGAPGGGGDGRGKGERKPGGGRRVGRGGEGRWRKTSAFRLMVFWLPASIVRNSD